MIRVIYIILVIIVIEDLEIQIDNPNQVLVKSIIKFELLA